MPILPVSANDTIYLENGQKVEQPSDKPMKDLKKLTTLPDGYQHLTDYANGYSIDLPAGMELDVSLSSVRNLVYDDNTRIEIYYDNFFNSASCPSTTSFINYNNRTIYNDSNYQITSKRTENINGLTTYINTWSRNKLAKVNNDHNYYASAYFVVNNKEVYTVLIKSTTPRSDYDRIFNSFKNINKQGSPGMFARFAPVEKEWADSTQAFYDKYFAEDSPLTWGIFEPTAPYTSSHLHYLEKEFDYNFPVILIYKSLDSPLPLSDLQQAYNLGKRVELTLQTSSFKLDERENQQLTYDILEGKYDEYFQQYARQIKMFGHPVMFRLNNEMNGDWCTYSSYYTAGDTELFKALWHYVYDIFEQEQVDNAIWVWNPHDLSFPDFKWNHSYLYYPGDEYVDIVGLTGYNTGNYYPGENWREFPYIYDQLVRAYNAVFEHPFMITEFGSNSVGGDKKAWIDNMFASIHNYPRIKMAIWWNGTDWDPNMNPARIYRIDETPEVMKAFRDGLAASNKVEGVEEVEEEISINK